MVGSSIIECIDFRPGREEGLGKLFDALEEAGDLRFFHPHPHDAETLERIAARSGEDLHCLLVEGDSVIGYGLLRGWDEGFDIPSLGIAIHPETRSIGLGTLLMEYLEMMAVYRGATSVRLRVMRANEIAIGLYVRRGYRFKDDPGDAELLVGHKPIGQRVI